MSANPSPSDSSAYFESLLHVGQQSMKQFDDALATTLGVDGKLSTSEVTSPFSFAMNMQRQYWTLIWRFWNATFVKAFAPGALLRSSQAIRRKHCNARCPMMP